MLGGKAFTEIRRISPEIPPLAQDLPLAGTMNSVFSHPVRVRDDSRNANPIRPPQGEAMSTFYPESLARKIRAAGWRGRIPGAISALVLALAFQASAAQSGPPPAP